MDAQPLPFADYLAICETKARYCRTLDSKDWDGFASVFTESLVLDTTGSGGSVIEGRSAAIARVCSLIGEARTAHQVHAPEIRFGGDRAEVTWARQDRVVWTAEEPGMNGILGLTGYGQYVETYERGNDGQWRIGRTQLKRFHVDYDRPQPQYNPDGGPIRQPPWGRPARPERSRLHRDLALG